MGQPREGDRGRGVEAAKEWKMFCKGWGEKKLKKKRMCTFFFNGYFFSPAQKAKKKNGENAKQK
jgi:hypothetical protein